MSNKPKENICEIDKLDKAEILAEIYSLIMRFLVLVEAETGQSLGAFPQFNEALKPTPPQYLFMMDDVGADESLIRTQKVEVLERRLDELDKELDDFFDIGFEDGDINELSRIWNQKIQMEESLRLLKDYDKGDEI